MRLMSLNEPEWVWMSLNEPKLDWQSELVWMSLSESQRMSEENSARWKNFEILAYFICYITFSILEKSAILYYRFLQNRAYFAEIANIILMISLK